MRGRLVGCLVLLALTGLARAAVVVGDGRSLSTGAGQAQQPSVSPDGAKVAYVSDRDGTDNVYVVPLAGGEAQRLTRATQPGTQMGTPRWSPAGDFLVYTVNREPGNSELWVISADGARNEALVKGHTNWMPSWSGDGHTIAFVSDRDGNDALYTINVDGSGLKRLADMTYEPACSPDGKSIAAYHLQAGADGIYLFDLDGATPPKLLLEGGRMPAWSADSRTLVAVKTEAGGSRLWRIDVARGAAEPFSAPVPGLAWPSLGRGGQVVYEARPHGGKELLVADVTDVRPLTSILEPAAGASVRGTVTVRGRVGAEAGRIAAWRLEAGAGASPGAWTLVAEGGASVDGDLGSWSTSGLEGIYTLRLTAVTDTGDTAVSTAPVTIYGQYGVLWQSHGVPATMSVGQSITVDIALKNNGTMTWRTDGPFAVYGSYEWLDEAGAVVVPEGPATPLTQAIGAGDATSLKATVVAPDEPGNYTLRYDLRQGDQVWFHEQGTRPLDVPVQVSLAFAAAIDAPSVPPVMMPGQIYAVDVHLTNRGTLAWQGQPSGPPAPDTVVVTTRWRGLDGSVVDAPPALTMLPQNVAPGQNVTLPAQVQAPSVNGRYLMSFELRDGAGHFGAHSLSPAVPVTVASPYGVQFLENNTPGRLFPGELVMVSLQARNTGSLHWRADGASAVRLVYSWIGADGRAVTRDTAGNLPYDVAPGQTAALSARLLGPAEAGDYTLSWDLLQDGGHRFAELGNLPLKVPVRVGAPTYGVRWEEAKHPVDMVVGATYAAEMRLVNIGSMSWPATGDGRVRLGYRWLQPSGEEVLGTPLFTELDKSVDGGERVRLTARVKAPDKPGHYLLRWDLAQNGHGWFGANGASTLDVPVTVDIVYGVRWLSHDTPDKVVTQQRYRVNVRFKNTGTIPWEPSGQVPVALVCRWINAAGNEVGAGEVATTPLPKLVQPGETVEVAAFLQAPKERGKFELDWDLQLGGVPFSDKGVEPLRVAVTVE
jgi:hypothetical protein